MEWHRLIRNAAVLLAFTVFSSGACARELIGTWSAEQRTTGGIASQWIFRDDGKATFNFGAVVDFRFEVKGSEIHLELAQPGDGDERTKIIQAFRIENGKLIVTNTAGETIRMERSNEGPVVPGSPLVGTWRYVHETGNPAVMRYSNNGSAQLSVVMKSFSGTYRAEAPFLALQLSGETPKQVPYSLDGSILVLHDRGQGSMRYRRFTY